MSTAKTVESSHPTAPEESSEPRANGASMETDGDDREYSKQHKKKRKVTSLFGQLCAYYLRV